MKSYVRKSLERLSELLDYMDKNNTEPESKNSGLGLFLYNKRIGRSKLYAEDVTEADRRGYPNLFIPVGNEESNRTMRVLVGVCVESGMSLSEIRLKSERLYNWVRNKSYGLKTGNGVKVDGADAALISKLNNKETQ